MDNRISEDRIKKYEKYKKFNHISTINVNDRIKIEKINEQYIGNVKTVVGRITKLTKRGIVNFAEIIDETGKISVLLRNEIGRDFRAVANKGDIFSFSGYIEKDKFFDEIICRATNFNLIRKCLINFSSVLGNDKERYGNRYLDFVVTQRSREILQLHSKINKSVKQYLWGEGFEEYHTPAISTTYNGGTSTPFVCDIKALNKKGYLRVSSELNMMQIIAAGMPAIFEINSQFRNEGMDDSFMQEFTLLEMYKTFCTTDGMLKHTLKMLETIFINANGEPYINCDDRRIRCGINDWRVVNAYEHIKENYNIDILTDKKSILDQSRKIGINSSENSSLTTIIENVIDRTIRRKIREPIIIKNLPCDMTPLVKKFQKDERFSDRYWLFLNNVDFCDIAAKQDEYKEQYNALLKQFEEVKVMKDNMGINNDILNTFAYGVPPTVGVGLSVTRLMQAMTGVKKITETSLFPLV